jgi:hypothetical protein
LAYALNEKDARDRIARASTPSVASAEAAKPVAAAVDASAEAKPAPAPSVTQSGDPAADAKPAERLAETRTDPIRDRNRRREARPETAKPQRVAGKREPAPLKQAAKGPGYGAPFGLGAGSGARWPGD